MENIKNLINISGSIGLSLLEEESTGKKVYIFYDDHSNKEYCKTNNFFTNNLFEYFYLTKENPIFLLEEPFVSSGENLFELWSDSLHIVKFKNFYYKLASKCRDGHKCKAYPTDLRLSLIDVSIEQIYENLSNPHYFDDYDITIEYYFRNLFYLFDIDNYYNTSKNYKNESPDKIIEFIKKVFSIFKNTNYYINLKNKVWGFYFNFIKGNEDTKIYDFVRSKYSHNFYYTKGYPFLDSNEYTMSDQIDKIFSGLMEFYIVILTNFIDNPNIIINAGYYHCNNIEFILTNYFHYKLIYNTGYTSISKIDESGIKNCLLIDKQFL